jgi:UDP-N-acetylmuramoyl-tripeptide--D-alanyl-D-alanine ligase
MIWSTKDLSSALNLKIHPNIHGEAIQFNSNSVAKGDLFIALKGNNDGHNYAVHALQNGANAVIISKEVVGLTSDKVIMVADTFLALQQMAEYKRQKSKAKFIAITGSSGKTSTKEATKIVLSHFGRTYASRGNFNNYLGVPINLASMPDDTEYAILEIGMNHAGEIRELTNVVKPDISVITTISEAHLEFFQSMLDLTDAKCEIFEGMSKEGVAVINLDNPYYHRILENLKKLSINNVFTFGTAAEANSRLELYQQDGQNVRLKYSGTKEISLTFIPKHFAINYAAILQIATILHLDKDILANQLAKILLTKGRGKIVKAKYLGQNYQLICDYYNANPESLKASLLYLKQVSGKNKIAIIGDMLELGENSAELHKALVPVIIDSGAKKILLVGDKVKHIYDLLPKELKKIHFANVNDLISKLAELLNGDELILIKGSRGIKLDKIIQSFELLP